MHRLPGGDEVQGGTAPETEERQHFHDRKSTALGLCGGLGKTPLVLGGVGQAQGSAVNDADVAALEQGQARCAGACRLHRMMECLIENGEGETTARLGEGSRGDGWILGAGERQEGTKLVAGFPEGGSGCKGLEEEEPEGALKSEEALTAVGAGGLWIKEMVRKEGGEEELQLRDGSGTDGAKAAAKGRQGAAKAWEERSEHRAVCLPPY